jgi:hypothetical protein
MLSAAKHLWSRRTPQTANEMLRCAQHDMGRTEPILRGKNNCNANMLDKFTYGWYVCIRKWGDCCRDAIDRVHPRLWCMPLRPPDAINRVHPRLWCMPLRPPDAINRVPTTIR